MKTLVEWFAKNPVAANLLMFVIIISGFITLGTIRTETFPETTLNIINISVPYPGASPEEVEQSICVRIEESIYDIVGIDRMVSRSVEGMGVISVELVQGADMRKIKDEIKSKIDTITTFPKEAETPLISEVTPRWQVLSLAVSGNVDEVTLKRIADKVRDELASIPGITQVEIANARPYEVSIEVSEETLKRYNLTFDQVIRQLKNSSLDLPGGSVKTAAGEIQIRTKGQAWTRREFEELPLIVAGDGTRLRLADIAKVKDGFVESDEVTRFDGMPSMIIKVFRVGNQSTLDVAEKVKSYVKEAQNRFQGIKLDLYFDTSSFLASRIDLLLRNGQFSIVLVFAILALFIRFRLAFWVVMGIPVAFLGAMWLLPAVDISINMLSLFAFILTVGIVVDDAIIVSENIYRHYQMGKTPEQAAIDGTKEVMIPVILTVLTTIAAFTPMIGLPGRMGSFLKAIPIIVILCLSFSLVESLFVLPHHLKYTKRKHDAPPPRGIVGWWSVVQRFVDSKLQVFIDAVYRPVLGFTLRWRYAVAAVGFSYLILTVALPASGYIKFVFFPPVDSDNITVTLTMPQGTPIEVTTEAIKKIEDAAFKVKREIEGDKTGTVFRHVVTSVGSQPFTSMRGQNAGSFQQAFSGSHRGEIMVELVPGEDRNVTATVVMNKWRKLTGQIADAIEVSFAASIMSSGDPINIQLSSHDIDDLRVAAEKLKTKLAEYPGVFDISDSYRSGNKELKLSITPSAEALGLTVADLARQVRQGFYGDEVQRIQRGRDDVRVMVRYPKSERKSIGNIENMRIRLSNGTEVPFSTVAMVRMGSSPLIIERIDRRRSVNVTADIDLSIANANEVLGDLKKTYIPSLLGDHQGLKFSFQGEQRQQTETMSGIINGTLIALLLIFALLAIPFRSYLQPIIVMLAIPFGLAGAVWAHMLMGMPLTMLSLIGMMALMGVVVNDSIVMVDFINRARWEGKTVGQAIRESGPLRFRAIILTSLTTFGGLTPMILEKSLQAQFLIPIAVSLGFGVMFATFTTLIIVPICYLLIDDVKTNSARLLFSTKKQLNRF